MRQTAAAVAATAASTLPGTIQSQESNTTPILAYRNLGSTGYRVTEIGMGCMNMRDSELVHAAIDSGINYFDTAYVYMNGQNEEVVGQVMKTKRDKVFLTTKVGLNSEISDVPGQIETSLKRLQTDHVDLLLLHHGGDTVELVRNNDRMKALANARDRGQTRFVGVSTHTTDPEIYDAIIDTGFYDAVLLCYNCESPKSLTESIEKVRKAGIAVIAMKTLISYESSPRKPLTDIREDKNGPVTMNQTFLKWVLANNYVDTIIAGISSFEHLAEDIAVMGTKMSSLDRQMIRRFSDAGIGTHCKGLTGCTACEGQCPKGVKVCELNRCLGYADGYGDMRLAWENYFQLPRDSRIDSCDDCDDCMVTCANGLDLNNTIRRARTLFA